MGQKGNSNLIRFGGSIIWKSEWFGLFNYNQLLKDDLLIRNYFSFIFFCLKCPTNMIQLKRSVSNWIYITIDIYIPEDQKRRFSIMSTFSLLKQRKKRINLKKRNENFLFLIIFYYIKY